MGVSWHKSDVKGGKIGKLFGASQALVQDLDHTLVGGRRDVWSRSRTSDWFIFLGVIYTDTP